MHGGRRGFNPANPIQEVLFVRLRGASRERPLFPVAPCPIRSAFFAEWVGKHAPDSTERYPNHHTSRVSTNDLSSPQHFLKGRGFSHTAIHGGSPGGSTPANPIREILFVRLRGASRVDTLLPVAQFQHVDLPIKISASKSASAIERKSRNSSGYIGVFEDRSCFR
jgi:hypothetical protein